MTERTVSKLQTFLNRCPRRILGIYWPATISNANLWETTGQAPVRQELTSRKWTWIGHTLRRPNYCIAHDKLFSGTRREVDGEGDRATAGGETQTTPSDREVFPGSSWNACPGTGGTGGTLSVAYVPRWNDSRLQIRSELRKADRIRLGCNRNIFS